MPSRYNITDDTNMHRLLSKLSIDLGPLPTRYNLAPTDQVPVIHQWEGQRLISDMRWWLVPHWCKVPSTNYPMFNARWENLEKSRAYHGCLRHRRCLIPAHSFVEWQHNEQEKTPYLFSAIEQSMIFAGLWDYWTNGIEHILSCAIITTSSSPEFEPYYSRMPVILTPDNAELWLDEKQDITILYSFFKPVLPYLLQAVAIDSQIGYAQNKSEPLFVSNTIFL
jgi:putative SOS response-associated peptidase YedK